ncbi:MAG: CHAT domain-containing protein [Pyrinomonadaceae bacterium]
MRNVLLKYLLSNKGTVWNRYNISAVFLLVFPFFPLATVAQTPSPDPFWGKVQKLREIKFGETVSDIGTPGAYHGYQLTMEAGTSVECNLGEREITVGMTMVIPDKEYPVPGDRVPESVDVGRISSSQYGLVEPVVIVADKAGKYVIRAIFTEKGRYSLSCGLSHPTTDRDRKYAAAQRLFLEIRQAVGARRKPLSAVADKIKERAGIYRSLGDKKSLALALNDVGWLHMDVNETEQALAHFREAMDLFKSLGSNVDVNRSLVNFRSVYESQGNYQQMVDYENQRLMLNRSSGSKRLEADALLSLGVIYHRLADETKAREYYEQFFGIQSAVDPPTLDSLNGQVLYFTNMANLSRGMNGGEILIDAFGPRTDEDYRKALEYLTQSLEINRKMETLFSTTARLHTFNLLQIANSYKELGQYPEALEYLDRFAAAPRSNRAGVAILYGSVYARKGDVAKASAYFEDVMRLLREGANPGNHTGYLQNIAKDYYFAGESQKALDALQEALLIDRSRQNSISATDSLFQIARIERDLGNFNNSRKNIEEAIQIAETVRSRITADELRTTYFSTARRFYEFYVDLLMQARKSQPEKAFDALALQASEKARSRSLLDLLTLSGIDIKEGVDPTLLAREKSIRERLAHKASQQSRLLLAKHTPEEASKIGLEVSDLTGEYQKVQAEIRNTSPRYAALTQPTPLNTKQIQQLLDSGTILLEYSLGEKKSYMWAVTPDSVTSFDLPGRDEIEKHSRKAYGLMTERNRQVKGETAAQAGARAKAADAEYPRVAAALSEMLLGPAADLIRNKRLLVVPDGALNYISFAALPLPKNREPNTVAAMSLGAYHEVVTLPSASTLARLREEAVGRKVADKMVAIFADPVFGTADSRAGVRAKSQATKNQSQNALSTRDFERALSDVGLAAKGTGGLPRLPFSRREADAIFAVSPKNLSLKEVDFKASKQEVFGANLDQYRILHFATHGLLDSQHPELSGVVLSLVDKSGNDIDGFLRLQDIYNLKLNADLVVLSACNTALGKEVRGEGLIGLTRGFMYAGAPRVVASLWKVDDAATAELMGTFYRKMLVDNLRPAAALRAAQTEMMKQPRWRSPYYWAPFVLQGEWK